MGNWRQRLFIFEDIARADMSITHLFDLLLESVSQLLLRATYLGHKLPSTCCWPHVADGNIWATFEPHVAVNMLSATCGRRQHVAQICGPCVAALSLMTKSVMITHR